MAGSPDYRREKAAKPGALAAGIEPATFPLAKGRSIQLSYALNLINVQHVD